MAGVTERVARLEERFDGVTDAIADLKVSVSKLDNRVAELRSEMRSEFTAVRGESASIRADMTNQFRWIMGGIGSAAMVILGAVLAAILAGG